MSELKILLRDERLNFRPGEMIEGVAGWRLGQPPRNVELRLFWFTRGKGTEDVGVVNQLTFSDPQLEEGRKFNFTLPPEPWSFSGQLVSLIWALELVVQPGNHSTRVEIVVSPSGREIQLHAHASA